MSEDNDITNSERLEEVVDRVEHLTRIRGKVAEVVSDREIILNKGSDDGVREGMYFAVLNPDTVGITDPDTGEQLGGIRVVKITVRAVEVAPKLTLARTFRTRRVNVGGSAGGGVSALYASLQPPKYVEEVEKLRLDKNSPRKLDPEESVVLRGDPFETATSREVADVRSISVWEEDDRLH
ncbi:hypothetical protein IT072_09800 [Leifsonia sp. ZF2019]|uniref:hypothetical protein n=1 Tax=Leifsonia sp. ZF2019 TaxID=2781978 RepID=UPI001CBE395D|nr:hypothetical protein [Leifsonia sp. ZF2019]UAJ81239.1 hypothetical protein IT072_09800 [Leifsonia sp. ZF2019]